MPVAATWTSLTLKLSQRKGRWEEEGDKSINFDPGNITKCLKYFRVYAFKNGSSYISPHDRDRIFVGNS